MKLVIFSGTTEGRTLSTQAAALGCDVIVSVATPLGAEEQGDFSGVTVHCGRLKTDEIKVFLQGADLCVDATHPYATEATRNIRAAAQEVGVEYHRLLRSPSVLPAGCLAFDTAAQAAEALSKTEGNILLTTGVKELSDFETIEITRIFPRVLPTQEGIAACEAAGIPHRNIIAMQGPFTRELNEAMMRQFSIQWLVTKDGGAAGGFDEKAEAAQNCGVKLVVIRRPQESGETAEQILVRCREMLL